MKYSEYQVNVGNKKGSSNILLPVPVFKGFYSSSKSTLENFSPAPLSLRQFVFMYLITSSRPSVNFSKSSL